MHNVFILLLFEFIKKTLSIQDSISSDQNKETCLNKGFITSNLECINCFMFEKYNLIDILKECQSCCNHKFEDNSNVS